MKIINVCLVVLLGLCALASAKKIKIEPTEYERPSYAPNRKFTGPSVEEEYLQTLATIAQMEPQDIEEEEEFNRLEKEHQENFVPYSPEDIHQEYEMAFKQIGLPCGKFMCSSDEGCCNDVAFNSKNHSVFFFLFLYSCHLPEQLVCYNLATHRCVNNIALCGINDRFCNDSLINGSLLCNPLLLLC